MTMFAEPILASSAEERMEGMRRDMENCRPRDYHHYPQHHETPDHLREKNYHYSDSDDREVGRGMGTFCVNLVITSWRVTALSYQSVTLYDILVNIPISGAGR